jgi:hypothetical protein
MARSGDRVRLHRRRRSVLGQRRDGPICSTRRSARNRPGWPPATAAVWCRTPRARLASQVADGRVAFSEAGDALVARYVGDGGDLDLLHAAGQRLGKAKAEEGHAASEI